MNDQRWTGTPMLKGTALKLYSELCRVYGKERTRLVVEVMPKAVMKTIDNEESAIKTLQNIRRVELDAERNHSS